MASAAAENRALEAPFPFGLEDQILASVGCASSLHSLNDRDSLKPNAREIAIGELVQKHS